MHKSSLRLIATTLMSAVSAGAVLAADLPNRKVAPVAFAPVPVASWTGIYLGVQAGVGMSTAEVKLPGGVGGVDGAFGRGLLGGVRIGADYQFSPSYVIGLMATADFGDIGGKANLGAGSFSLDALRLDGNKFSRPGSINLTPRAGTGSFSGDGGVTVRTSDMIGVRVRLGYLVTPDTLIYVAPGWASAKGTLKARIGSWTVVDPVWGTNTAVLNDSFRQSKRINGWQLGLGFETRVSSNLSINFEYVYSQFADFRIGTSDVKTSVTTGAFMAGLNYRFGVDAGARPAAAAPAPENWSGFYAGLSGAGGIGGAKVKLGSLLTVDGLGSSGFSGGVVAGYDWQVAPRWVVGAEVGADLTSFETSASLNEPSFTGDSYRLKVSMPWALTARLRAGYLMSPGTLVFASLGLTGGQFKVAADANGYGIKQTSSTYGAMVGLGGGFQMAISRNVFLRMEYQHALLPEMKVKGVSFVPVKIEPTSGNARVSLIYKM